MSPDVFRMLLLGGLLCLAGASIIGLMARDKYLRHHRRKANRAIAAAPTAVYRKFETRDAFALDQSRREDYRTWQSWETVADKAEPPTQVIRYDTAGRRAAR